MTEFPTPPYEQLVASALSRPMRMLLSLPQGPVLTVQAAEAAHFENMPARKATKIMSQLSGRGLVRRVGTGCYQITALGLKVQARLKQHLYGFQLESTPEVD